MADTPIIYSSNSTITSHNYDPSNHTKSSTPINGTFKTLAINGRDVMQELDEIRNSLLLLKRHVDMEAKYPRLKEIKDEYEQTLAKYKTFDILATKGVEE